MSSASDLFVRAQRAIAGGVNSPVRAFRAVGGEPVFFSRGKGPYVFSTEGKQYLDYVCSWGAIIVGHAHAATIDALHAAIANGLSFGACTEIEVQLAEKINSMLPNSECVRMVSSGTEAAMTAIRLARGVTGRNKIIKFVGCYHGHSDALLVKAGSGVLTLGIPSSAGVPKEVTQHTLVANFNDLDSVQALFSAYGDEIAAVIVEPIAGNMNLILPVPGFLQGLRDLCDKYASLLIFDEVMTGFRVGAEGAQGLYAIKPDLTLLGKVIGGGLPAAALAGSRELLEHLAPTGDVYQAGTLSGNPIAMTAGLATLEAISQPGFYTQLNQIGRRLAEGLRTLAQQAGISLCVTQEGGMLGLVFSDKAQITSFADVAQSDLAAFTQFFHGLLVRGVSLPPSAYEAFFISAAHGEREIASTLQAVEDLFKQR